MGLMLEVRSASPFTKTVEIIAGRQSEDIIDVVRDRLNISCDGMAD